MSCEGKVSRAIQFALMGVLALVLASCYGTLEGFATYDGQNLNDRITHNRIRAAVLPTVDWSNLDTKKGNKPTGFDDIQVIVTNEITRALWQKNSLLLVKKGVLIPSMESSGLTMEEVFPQPNMSSKYPTPLTKIEAIGRGEPNYEKLAGVGRNMGADLLFLTRVTRNCRDGKRNDVIVDVLVVDVANKVPIAWGFYGARMPREGETSLANAARTILYYAPLPDSAFLARERSAQSTAGIANFLMQDLAGINLNLTRAMGFADETWQMYPRDYFEQNHQITLADHGRMYRR